MAQVVEQFSEHVTLTEGPFVICHALGIGWRIEAEYKGYPNTVAPHISIFHLRWKLFGRHSITKTRDKQGISAVCDKLNELVLLEEIKLVDNHWVYQDKL